jgi:hypothetical protein
MNESYSLRVKVNNAVCVVLIKLLQRFQNLWFGISGSSTIVLVSMY